MLLYPQKQIIDKKSMESEQITPHASALLIPVMPAAPQQVAALQEYPRLSCASVW